MRSPYTESGQVALIIVLTSVVLLTLGVGAVAKSTTDINLSVQSHESAAAFAAAEAGIEVGLLTMTSGTWQLPPVPPAIASATYTVTELPEGASYDFGTVEKGDSRTVWLIDDRADPYGAPAYNGTVSLEWDPDTAEIEVAAYYRDSGDLMVQRTVVDSGDRITLDSSAGPINDEWIALRVRPIMENVTHLVVSGYNGTFPVQGHTVESNGFTASGIRRKIVVSKMHEDVPGIFDFTIMSNSQLLKP